MSKTEDIEVSCVVQVLDDPTAALNSKDIQN